MVSISKKYHSHDCLIDPFCPRENQLLLDRITDTYLSIIQDFSQWLFRSGWTLSSLMIPSLFGEPIESTKSAIRRMVGWKSPIEKLGFFDARNPKHLDKLEEILKTSTTEEKTPLLLLHGFASTPDVWIPWGPILKKAQEKGRIGRVLVIQLPNDLTKRMEIVYDTIDKIASIYQRIQGTNQVDIVGHSKGGFAGHLAAFQPKSLRIKEDGTERRWHSLNAWKRNQHVRKVVSVAAPTWLCCEGQKDETTVPRPKREDIYPQKICTEKNIVTAYTSEQLKELRDMGLHHDIYDIVGTQDAISPILSPLAPEQVFYARHQHLGLTTCPRVCQLAIKILEGKA